jgi:hypothetical protein
MTERTTLCIVGALILASAIPAAGQNRKITGEAALGYLEVLQPPTIRCAGGEPTGLAYPPYCSPGTSRVLGRDEVQRWIPVSTSASLGDLLNGPITFVINCNFNPEYRGPCWGTFTWEVTGVGTWTGSWTSPVMDLYTYETRFSMVGFGAGGSIDGRQIRFDGGSAPGDWYITGTIRIN